MSMYKKFFAQLSYIMLFPSFYVYNFLIANGIIKPYLGGYFSFIAIFVFLISLFAINRRVKLLTIEILFLTYEFLLLVFYICNYFLNQPTIFTKEIFENNFMSCIHNLALYFVAKNLCITKRFAYITFLFFMIFLLMTILNISDIDGILNLRELENNLEFVSTYQGISRSLLFTSLIFLVYFFRNNFFFLFFIVVCYVLYLGGSRTEFYFGAFSILITYLITNNFIKNVFFFIFPFILVVFFLILNNNILIDNRILSLLNLTNDTSAIARIEEFIFSIQIIQNNPILPNYGQYVFFNDSIGHYAHTFILSSWLDLGIFGLLYLLVIVSVIIYFLIKGFFIKNNNIYFIMFAITAIYFVMSFVFSKNYTFLFLGFTVGMCANYISNTRKENNEKKL